MSARANALVPRQSEPASAFRGGTGSPVQRSALRVSSPADPAEREATSAAHTVVNMRVAEPAVARVSSAAAGVLRRQNPATLDRLSHEPGRIQRSAAPAAPSGGDVQSRIQSSLSGGEPLPGSVRRFMEPRFGASFANVRVHTDASAASLSREVAAQAFTTGNHIFFARDRFQPDTVAGRELLAHELTHTIQQGAVARDPAASLQRQEDVTITPQPQGVIQRVGIDTVLSYIADKANIIPGFRMFTIVLGVNPINMSAVDASPANILRAAIEFIPGGGLVTQALDSSGVFEQVATWAAQQIKSLGLVGSAIKKALMDFLGSLDFTDLLQPGSVWDRAKAIFTGPIDRIKNLLSGLVTGIIKFVKDAILKPIAKLAEGTPSYDLLKGVMGKDPITGEPVSDSAELLIGGFLKLIGQQDVWDNMAKSGAVPRAWAWFKGAIGGLKSFVQQIPATFVAAFMSLQLADIVLIPRAFGKIAGVFGAFLGRFVTWAGEAVWNLLEIIFAVVAPGALDYVKRTGEALKSILKNPLPFVGNLVKAAKLGFQNFASHFGAHLQQGLIDWLTGSLAGVYIPKALSLGEIVKFAFSVLGLTWQNLRAKLVTAVGDTVVQAMEKGFDIVKTLVTQGPAAAWEQIKDELVAQKDKVVDGIKDMVIDAVVTKAIPKLLAMFIPGAGFISAIISIYDTVMVFVQQIKKIAQVVTAFIDSIVAIAGGAIGAAADRVESILAGLLSLAINFLAGFAGLGKIASKINGIIQKIRAPIDKALDSMVAWIKKTGKKFLDALKKGARALLNWWKKKVPVNGGGEKHTLTFDGTGPGAKLVLRSTPQLPSVFLTSAADTRPSVKGAKRNDPIATASTQEKAVIVVQARLAAIDDNDSAAASKAAEKKAEADMKDLDGKLITLGAHLVKTLDDWGVPDGDVKTFTIPRGSFSPQQKRDIAAQHPDKSELKLNSKGEMVNLGTRKGETLARRHVVSSHDMGQHYSAVLADKKWSQAKLLLEQRGSIGLSHTPVTGTLGQETIKEAALRRYAAFFGYAKNLFIGDSRENSSIQEHLDKGHPDLADQKLEEHVTRIKRSWAIDDTIKISRIE